MSEISKSLRRDIPMLARRLLLLGCSATAAYRLSAVPAGRVALAASPMPMPALVSASRSLYAATHSISFYSSGRALTVRVSCARSSGIRASADLEAGIKSTVADNKVVIYSKSWCPFCMKTKSLFDGLGVPYTAVELDQVDDGQAIQEALLDLTQQRTVPNVFVNGGHVGGNDDTQKFAASGELQKALGM